MQVKMSFRLIGLFRVTSFSKRVFVQHLSFENEFNVHEKEPYELFCTKTRFDTEAKGNVQTTYCLKLEPSALMNYGEHTI